MIMASEIVHPVLPYKNTHQLDSTHYVKGGVVQHILNICVHMDNTLSGIHLTYHTELGERDVRLGLQGATFPEH